MAYRAAFKMNRIEKNKERLRISNNDVSFLKGKIIYKHENANEPSGAFLTDEGIFGELLIPRLLLTDEVNIKIYSETLKDILFTTKAEMTDLIDNDEIYSFCIPRGILGKGLYFAEISVANYDKKYFAYNECCELVFSEEKRPPDIQISVSDFEYGKPDIYGGIIYHIFVDRFFKDKAIKNKKEQLLKWDEEIPEYQKFPGEPIKNEYFYGGNLYGITEKLKYLSELGITTIYLSPIFEAVSNHKYDTADYMKVDESFGGDKALETLIKTADKFGIGVILDGVFNHTGSNSLYFNKYGKYGSGGAYNTKNSEYYKWYNFKKYPDDYDLTRLKFYLKCFYQLVF